MKNFDDCPRMESMQPRGGHLDVGASWDDFYGKNLLPSSILSCWGWRGLAFFLLLSCRFLPGSCYHPSRPDSLAYRLGCYFVFLCAGLGERKPKNFGKRNKNLVWVKERRLWRFLWRERNNFFLLLFFVLPEVRKKTPLSPCV